MRYLTLSIISLLLLCSPALAEEISEVESLIRKNIDAVVLIVQNKELHQKDKNEKVVDIVNSILDFQLMAKLSLGKKYWPKLSKEEREEFTDLFVKRLQDSYVEKLVLYSDEKVVYESPQKVKKRIHMQTYMISKDNKISMLFKLYDSKTSWRIYDIEIQGVSIIQSFRSQFDGVLKTGTITDLLEKLEAPDQIQFKTPEP